jgi:transposase
LYAIGTQQSSATQWAKATGRENETILGWIHRYNQGGPATVVYRHSGGRTPFLPKRQKLKSSPSSKRARPESMSFLAGGGR